MKKQVRRPITPLIAEELEPRILYSGDLTPLVTDEGQISAASSSIAHITASSNLQLIQTAQTTNQADVRERHEIVFIDSTVDGYETLAKEITADNSANRNVEVVIIDAGRDGIP